MGILDSLDNPGILSAMLGIPPDALVQGQPPQSQAMPRPPMPVPQPPQAGMDPAQQAALLNVPPQAIVSDLSPGPAPASGPASAPPLPPPIDVGYAPGAQPKIPLPQPDPRATNGAEAPAIQPPNGGVPMPPPSSPGPTTSTTGNLSTALGLPGNGQPPPAAPQRGGFDWGSTIAGVGKGLSAVGAQRPGASAGAAFAAGAGGALTGQYAAQQQAKQQLFNNQSTYFKDFLAAQQHGDQGAVNEARANYFNSVAQSIMAGKGRNGTGGSSAWQNTPYGKTIQIEHTVNAYEKGQQIMLQKQWAQNGASTDQQQKDLDALKQNTEAYRQRLYKTAGINGDDAQKYQTMGTSQTNPFDTKGMNMDQFNAMVPMGAWFKTTGSDGKERVMQRTVAPPQATAQPQAPAAAASSPTMFEADQPPS